jgi:hypothetical protein
MNPINAQGNMFANLFDKVPAKRPGVPEDIIATILYLVSKAGVGWLNLRADGRLTSMDDRCVWMEGGYWLQMAKNKINAHILARLLRLGGS